MMNRPQPPSFNPHTLQKLYVDAARCARQHHQKAGLSQRETELWYFLDELFQAEFGALQALAHQSQTRTVSQPLLTSLITLKLGAT